MPEILDTPDIKTEDKTDLDKVWKTIVWDDPVNSMAYVTHVFQKVLSVTKEKAEKLMYQVHTEGSSVVFAGSFEQAEHYVHAIANYSLHVTLEQDS